MSPQAVLVGLPGAGKSSVGRRLAKILVLPFADSDKLVETAAGRSVSEIFTVDGEAEFRRLEASAIAAALTDFDGILALGGGALTTESTRWLLRSRAVEVVWLQASTERLLERLGDGENRPLLAGDPAGGLARLSAEREPLYRAAATMTADGTDRTPSQLAAHLAARLHSREVRR